MQTKKSLRAEVLKKLRSLKPEELETRSLLIKKKLFSLDVFKKAECVCFYVSLGSEADTKEMIDDALASKKRVLVPLTNVENKELSLYEITDRCADLKKGAYGVMEPRPGKTRLAHWGEVDCVIVPGIVFDKKNHRIGHGIGYYDRFLKNFGSDVLKIGLAFSFQVVPAIPAEVHDVKLDMVLTD